MEFPNAFIGRKTPPSAKDLAAKLGPSANVWKELVAWLTSLGLASKQWHSISPKYGWSLIAMLKDRRIVYLSPCDGCFRASFVLSDKAVAAARAGDLPKDILKEIAQSKRYAEGTGVRLLARSTDDLSAIRKLVEIKMQN